MSGTVLRRRAFSHRDHLLSHAQKNMDGLLDAVQQEFSNPLYLGALTAGSLSYRFSQIALGKVVSPLMFRSGPLSQFFLNTLMKGSSLAVEVGVYRSLHSSPIPQAWMASYLDFGLMKLVSPLGRNVNPLTLNLMQSNAMLGGQEVSRGFGWMDASEGNYIERLVRASSLSAAMMGGMGMVAKLSPGLIHYEKSLDLHLQSQSSHSQKNWDLSIRSANRLSLMAAAPMSAPDFVSKMARWGKRSALVDDQGENISYEHLASRIRKLTHYFQSIHPESSQSPVGMFFESGNRLEFFEIAFAAMQSGLAFCPFVRFMNPRLVVNELVSKEYKLFFLDGKAFEKFSPFLTEIESAGVKLIDIDNQHVAAMQYRRIEAEFADGASNPVRPLSNPAPYIFFRPISTGFERVEHDASVMANYRTLNLRKEDKHLVMDYLFHEGDVRQVLAHLEVGAQVYVPRDRSIPSLHRQLEENPISQIILHPWYIDRLYDEHLITPRKFPNLKRVIIYADHFQLHQRKKAVEVFGPNVVHYIYSTTHQGLVTALSPQDLIRKPHSVGKAIEGVEIEVRPQEGELSGSSGDGVIYVRTPFTDGKFVRTYEMGSLDSEGFLSLKVSPHPLVSSRGSMISPSLVEAGLRNFACVGDCVVFGVPDSYSGQNVLGAIALRNGMEFNPRELQRGLKELLPDVRFVPKVIIPLPQIPRFSGGEVDESAILKVME